MGEHYRWEPHGIVLVTAALLEPRPLKQLRLQFAKPEQPVEPPAPLMAEAALDQAGQEFGAIMLTRKPHARGVAAWPVDWRRALTCSDRRRWRTHWGSRESQLLPRFLENLLCFGDFVEQLIG
jgi:hypothetical protein